MSDKPQRIFEVKNNKIKIRRNLGENNFTLLKIKIKYIKVGGIHFYTTKPIKAKYKIKGYKQETDCKSLVV